MKYKTIFQFKWISILWLIGLIYLSTLILVKLPFFSMGLQKLDFENGYIKLFESFFPKLNIEWQLYNLQSIVVWFSGIVFGPVAGLTAVSIYLILGFIGIPVFAGGGGFDYYQEPTFGYLISLPFSTYLSGWLFEKNKKILAAFLPILNTHLIGILYLLIFKPDWLNISWHLSFSMITYDVIFAFLLIPVLPLIIFFLREMFIQEVPVYKTSTQPIRKLATHNEVRR